MEGNSEEFTGRRLKFVCLLASALILSGCVKTETAASQALSLDERAPVADENSAAMKAEAKTEQEYAEAGADAQLEEMSAYRKRAHAIVSAMDDAALAAQVIIAGLDGNMHLSAGMKRLLQNSPPGAIMLFSYNLTADKGTTRSFLKECADAVAEKSVAPFLAVDHEGGRVHRFSGGVRRLPSAESYWYRTLAVDRARTLEEIERHAFVSGTEIHDVGVTMNFAPVAEILTKENARFLDTRSYGPDPVFVEAACAAFIRGMERSGVACVVKHFPGNADADPHEALPTLAADRATLDYMIKPFAGLIRAGQPAVQPAAVMVSHVVARARDAERPASLSPLIVDGWLRGELGFTGIAAADDFSMGAVAASGIKAETAAITALNAGIDMVMAWPPVLASTHKAILDALKTGGVHRDRLEEAAERIVFQKLRFGLVSMEYEPLQ
ncbi:MAG: glycoside hydrolase family 3 protein [Treponema sp.]|nr:glycoside hydrolase family 3 protein [Treponema sp.]